MKTAILLRGLRYAYPDGREALRGLSLTVGCGEKVALVGPNGAGKSTLLLHLNGLLRGEGEVKVLGRPVIGEEIPHLRAEVGGRNRRLPSSTRQIPHLRAEVGLVFQNPDDQLFSPTVFDDVAFGPLHMGLPAEEVRRRAAWALDQVGMADAAPRMPHHLSLGERKRVAIATVLAMQPRLLLLDEPTAGLDPRARRDLITLLKGLPQTMLVATHDMRLVAQLCNRVVVMDEGEIVADGPADSLLYDAALMEAHGLEVACDC